VCKRAHRLNRLFVLAATEQAVLSESAKRGASGRKARREGAKSVTVAATAAADDDGDWSDVSSDIGSDDDDDCFGP
jgi:hypothetical protein